MRETETEAAESSAELDSKNLTWRTDDLYLSYLLLYTLI